MPKPFFKDNHVKKLKEIIRVNHAGEFGAQKIYEGQIRHTKNPKERKLLEHMLTQEQKHLDYFSDKIRLGSSRPTIFMPLWNVGGFLLGAISAKISNKTAMNVTKNVEIVIEKHYQDQIDYLKEYDPLNPLLEKIEEFKNDETEHKHIAIENNGNDHLSVIEKATQVICKIAISLSKRL